MNLVVCDICGKKINPGEECWTGTRWEEHPRTKLMQEIKSDICNDCIDILSKRVAVKERANLGYTAPY